MSPPYPGSSPPSLARAVRRLLALFLLGITAGSFAMAAPSPAGLVSFQRVPVPDEIPAHLVTALAQDLQGFLWIGTQGGLVRYDGYQFRVYKNDPNNPGTLGGSYVRSLYAAADGRLWAGTFSNGLSVYDPVSESFTRYEHDPKNPASLAHNRVEGLAEDRAGNLWIGTYEGLDRLDPRTGKIDHFRHAADDPASLADDRVRALLVDRQGRLWVGSRGGLQLCQGGQKGFLQEAPELAGQFVSKLFEDSQGRIWIGTTDHGAAVLDPAAGSLHRFAPQGAQDRGLSHFWVYGIAEVTPGEIWIATFGGGIDVIDAKTLQIVERLRHDPALEGTIGSDRIGAMLRDRSGFVWVGTWGQGLARHDPAARAFRALRHSPNRPDGLSHPEIVRALEMRDGTVWAGTNGNGVDVLDRQGRRIAEHRPDLRDPGALSDGSVTCLAQGPDGSIWVATLNGVLHRLRPGARRFERLSQADGLPAGAIRTMIFGPDGTLWAGAAEGLARLDPGTSRITSYRHQPDDPATLSGLAVESLAFTADGTLWAGTESGLNAFDPRTGKAVRIPFQPGRPDSLPANWVPDLLVARDGRLWIATQAGACILQSWDGRTARFERIAELLQRPAGPVDSLIEDAQGWIWLGPRLRVNPRTWQAQDLGPADGCDFHSFFIASRSRTADGGLLFGSAEGLLWVRPEKIRFWTYEPPVVATSLRIDGRERPGASRLDRLVLEPAQKGFRLDFAALDFTAPSRNAYRYRLDGFDDDWVQTDSSQRSLTYTSLRPGSYTLRVQGTNRAGLWSSREIRLPVTVFPAFYQTTAFRLLLALLAAALAYGIYRLRVRRLQARSETLERLVGERTLTLEERSRELAEKNRELAATYARLEEASLTDPLTQLRNRRFLDQGIESDLEIAARRHEDGQGSGAALVFLLLDLDHFKNVNDTYGHAAGDAVLIQTADLLRSVFRASDHRVRWGGEEILIVVRFVDRREAPALAEKIRAAIESHEFRLEDGTVLRRTGSVGFAVYPFSPGRPRAVGWQEIVDIADLGLYAAKRGGRNRWVGVEAGAVGNPEDLLRHLREDPEGAVARGEARIRKTETVEAEEVRWD